MIVELKEVAVKFASLKFRFVSKIHYICRIIEIKI